MVAAVLESERRKADVARSPRIVRDEGGGEGDGARSFGVASRQRVALLPDVQREVFDPELLLLLRIDDHDERLRCRADPERPPQFLRVQLARQRRDVGADGARRQLEDLVKEELRVRPFRGVEEHVVEKVEDVIRALSSRHLGDAPPPDEVAIRADQVVLFGEKGMKGGRQAGKGASRRQSVSGRKKGRTEGRTEGRRDGRTEGRKDGRTDGKKRRME